MSYLVHHGIKGQKWGVRRFQNKDGTRTAAGKKREMGSSKDSKNLKNRYSNIKERLRQENENIRMQLQAIHDAFMQGMEEEAARQNMSTGMNYVNQLQNQQFMDFTVNEAVRASNMAASLSMTGGMNPFMFG